MAGSWKRAANRELRTATRERTTMKRLFLSITLITVTALSVAIYARRGSPAPEIATDVVTRGSIAKVISASGTLEAVETVQVGTQVSGSVKALYADFNSIVRKGQVLARLDPLLIQADINRAQATLLGAEADRERVGVTLADAEMKLQRARELFARQLIPQTDLDTAEMSRKTADAQVRAANAQVTQAKAALSQAQVNLAKTVINSPIDGIVISRSVDVGQTVAASLQAPTLFTIAADLSQMQVNANIDESDVGSIHEGQPVTFRVDAYPNQVFRGTVRQVRLNPVVAQNVVTYAAIVTAPNADFMLKPGMTANLTVEVTRRDNVLRIPAQALRFKPAATTATTGKPASPSDRGTVWVVDGDVLQPVQIKVGLTDGTFTELVDGAVGEGTTLATRATVQGSQTPARPAGGSNNPLMGSTPPRRF
jgi:HlyD family secretion protein